MELEVSVAKTKKQQGYHKNKLLNDQARIEKRFQRISKTYMKIKKLIKIQYARFLAYWF